MQKKINLIIDEIIDQYLYADETNRPWIIGFSGGKDSTVMLQLVWEAIVKIKQIAGSIGRPIYVVCNDTMVENPIITEYVYRILDLIEKAAIEQDMPIQIKKTIPRLEDSFWVNLIGRGYPAPNNAFRWCTERLKIKPTSRILVEQINEFGEAIILIGTRKSESASRAKSIKKHEIRGKRLTKHPLEPNTYMYAPIKELSLEEVWYILNTRQSPWGANNDDLFQIYSDASADDYECPTLVTNDKHKSCGQSRFGCWVCTVVKEDKSMTALIDNGLEWLKPLLDFRNNLVKNRNIIENRLKTRRNGTLAKEGMGSYTPKYRAEILEELFKTQLEIKKHKPYLDLITKQELIAIQVIWYRDFIFEYKVSDIFKLINKTEIDMKNIEEQNEKEDLLLKKVCTENNHMDNYDIIKDLLKLQKNKSLLNRKRGLNNSIEARILDSLKEEK